MAYIKTDGNKPIGKGGKLPPRGDYNIWDCSGAKLKKEPESFMLSG